MTAGTAMEDAGYQVLAKRGVFALAIVALAWQWVSLPGQMGGNTAFAEPPPVVHVLSESDSGITIENDGDVHIVYGTSRNQHYVIEKGAKVHLCHCPGENIIRLETLWDKSRVSRSGAMVTIRNDEDGTFLKLPATHQKQQLRIYHQASVRNWDLEIMGNEVFLGGQRILVDEAPILHEDKVPHPIELSPAHNASAVRLEQTKIAIRFSQSMDISSTFTPDTFKVTKYVNGVREVVEWNSPYTISGRPVVYLSLREAYLSRNAIYEITMTPGLKAKNGNRLPKQYHFQFYTFKEKSFDLGNGVSLKLLWIPKGWFLMGGDNAFGSWWDARPSHKVTFTQGFWMGKYEVTREQWVQLMNPSQNTDDPKLPIASVSWNDIQAFIEKLNEKTGETFSLPTEAQWEYAARGSDNLSGMRRDLGDIAWYSGNSGDTTHPVGKKNPTVWGLYDMRGNVSEWCQDWYGRYPSGAVTNPTGPDAGDTRVVRGENFKTPKRLPDPISRNMSDPDVSHRTIGFRVVMQP